VPETASQPAAEPVDSAVQALIERLSDTDGTVRKQSAEGLRKRGDRAAVPALIRRVADDRWISPPRFRGTNNASDPEAGGKTAALEALKELAPDKATEALRQAQKSKNANVRAWATRELTQQ
jgi:HEAT repeat protein